jgi:integrase
VTSKRRGHGEGSIYRRNDGVWSAAVDLGIKDGKRRRKVVYGKTQAEVRDRLRELQWKLNVGVTPPPERLTVGAFLNVWLEELLPGTVSERTEDIYRRTVRLYVAPNLGALKLSKVAPADVSRMLMTLESRGFAPETRRLARAVLRRALRRAEQEGMVARNVAAIADGPRVSRREGRTLTPEEARRFLEAVRGHRLEAAYIVALALGLRRGEVLGLCWSDIDLVSDAPAIHVRRQLLRNRAGLGLSDLKTAGSRRTLYLSEPVANALSGHRVRQDRERTTAGPLWIDQHGMVFTTPVGKPLDVDGFGKSVPKISESVGLGHWSIHELRHSCASLLLAMGVPLEVVSETLGHASIKVTKDVYGHLLAESKIKAAEAMRKALWVESMPAFDPMATNLATKGPGASAEKPVNRDAVGRPGLDPGTLGLKVLCSSG